MKGSSHTVTHDRSLGPCHCLPTDPSEDTMPCLTFQLIYSLSGKSNLNWPSSVSDSKIFPFYFVPSWRNAIRSSRSFFFLRPANTIFVPGMYFLGFVRYSSRVSAPQVMPFFLLASVYVKPAACPVCRPMRPFKLGPCLCLPPFS